MIRKTLDIHFLKVAVHLFVGTRSEIDSATKKSLFNELPDLEQDAFAGRALHLGGNFGIQIVKNSVIHGVIAHEIFHVTHRIWNYLGDRFYVEHNEPYAFLQEYLTDWVYKQLKCASVRAR